MKWIAKREFIAAAKKGWKKLGFCRWAMWYDENHVITERRREAKCACAAGAACWSLGGRQEQFTDMLVAMGVWNAVVNANDNHSKIDEKAKALTLRRIAKIKWPRKPRS